MPPKYIFKNIKLIFASPKQPIDVTSMFQCLLNVGSICSCTCVYTSHVSGGEARIDSKLPTATAVSL